MRAGSFRVDASRRRGYDVAVMRATFSSLLTSLLVALLVVTGYAASSLRAHNSAATQIVICVGAEVQSIYIDADGNPTAPPHHCPDCILMHDTGRAAHLTTFQTACAPLEQTDTPALAAPASVAKSYLSRAPPPRV